jgi:ligand-binding sensor domain-containing protein
VPAHYSVSQLFHTQWTAQSGAPAGIDYMAQTSDGFLWLATSGGLFRFDGVEFERFTGTGGVPLLSQDIYTLHATPDGDLWIGHHFGGASQLHNGRLANYGREQGLPTGSVTAFAKTPDGMIWAGA